MPVKKNLDDWLPRLQGVSNKVIRANLLTSGQKKSYWVKAQDFITNTVLGNNTAHFMVPEESKVPKFAQSLGDYQASSAWPRVGSVLRVPKIMRWINCFQYQGEVEGESFSGGGDFDQRPRAADSRGLYNSIAANLAHHQIDSVYYDWYWDDDYRDHYGQEQWENVGYDQLSSLFEALTPDLFSDMLTTVFAGAVEDIDIAQNVPNIPPYFLAQNVLNVVVFAELGALPSPLGPGTFESVPNYAAGTFEDTWTRLIALHQMLNQWFPIFTTMFFYDMTPLNAFENIVSTVTDGDGNTSLVNSSDLFPAYQSDSVAGIEDIITNQVLSQYGASTKNAYTDKPMVQFGSRLDDNRQSDVWKIIAGYFKIPVAIP